jgi:hypothetical protein
VKQGVFDPKAPDQNFCNGGKPAASEERNVRNTVAIAEIDATIQTNCKGDIYGVLD